MPGFIIYKDYNKENKKLSNNEKQILNCYKQLLLNEHLNIMFFTEEQIKYIDDLYKLIDIEDIIIMSFFQSNIKHLLNEYENLEYLYLNDCYNLENLPEILPNIKDIEINNCNKLNIIK